MSPQQENQMKIELVRLDVFHSLHCLNVLRKAAFPDHYSNESVPHAPRSWAAVHRDHCIDHLRQVVQCGGDLSPAPFYAWKGFAFAIATGKTHTCRKFDKIREWMSERNQEMEPAQDDDVQ